jgi:uncharacterized membrane protein
LSIAIPADRANLTSGLWDRRDEVLSFALSFAVIGRYWLVHHRLFSAMTAYTSRFVVLNLAFLGTISFVPFPTQVLGDFSGESAAVMLYALTLAVVSALSVGLWDYAQRAGLMAGDRTDPDHRHYYVIPLVFALSAPLALVSPRAASLSWILIFLVRPDTLSRLRTRR